MGTPQKCSQSITGQYFPPHILEISERIVKFLCDSYQKQWMSTFVLWKPLASVIYWPVTMGLSCLLQQCWTADSSLLHPFPSSHVVIRSICEFSVTKLPPEAIVTIYPMWAYISRLLWIKGDAGRETSWPGEGKDDLRVNLHWKAGGAWGCGTRHTGTCK